MDFITQMQTDLAKLTAQVNAILNNAKQTSEFDSIILPFESGDYVRIDRNGQSFKILASELAGGSGGPTSVSFADVAGSPYDNTQLENALNGKEASLGIPASNGLMLLSNTDGTRYWGVVPTSAVTSVNTQTGDVVLNASDVGALPDNTTTITVAQANDILNNKQRIADYDANGTEVLKVKDPLSESVSQISTNQKQVNEEVASSLFLIRDAIRQIAGASATFDADPVPQLIDTNENQLTLIEALPSTQPEVISIDSANNTMTIHVNGRYQFSTFLNVSNVSNTANETLTLRTRDVSNDDIITERDVAIPGGGYSGSSGILFDVDFAPVTIKFSLQGSHPSRLALQTLQTSITTGAAVNPGGGPASTWENNIDDIRALTSYASGIDMGNYATGIVYQFDTLSLATDDGVNVLKPDDLDVLDAGRWLKKINVNAVYESLTFAQLVARQDAGGITLGDRFKITDQSDLLIEISHQSPDGNSWYDTIDNQGAIITQNIE